ncbi:MAG: hypothetical protein ACR2KQ_04650 [Actinomycetota bacterium]
MTLWRRLRPLVALSLVLSFASLPAAATAPPNLEANVIPADFPSEVKTFPGIDHGGRKPKPIETDWRIFQSTGNCCENYLTTDKAGNLYDFGGSYINVTADRGKTWEQVRPLTPLVNGEGAISAAPGGDIVGVQWDPYSGDHLLSFKYDAAQEKWLYAEMPVHVPFYDREWIGVVPGPVTVLGETVPYVSFIKGAWPAKEVWFFSTDGLNYDTVDSKYAQQAIFGGTTDTLTAEPHREMDWIQPNSNSGMTPLGVGRMLARPDAPAIGQSSNWGVFEGDFGKWSTYEGNLQGRFQVDSAGRIHNVIPEPGGFLYRISTNGGKSWTSTKVSLPREHEIEEIDFRAHKQIGIAAVAIHAHNSKASADADLLYKFDIKKNEAKLLRFNKVGLGDLDGASGVGASIRFDFETVTIFPDGRVAMSFYDSTTGNRPLLAVEGKTRSK